MSDLQYAFEWNPEFHEQKSFLGAIGIESKALALSLIAHGAFRCSSDVRAVLNRRKAFGQRDSALREVKPPFPEGVAASDFVG